MKQKRPQVCRSCEHWHKAGHSPGTPLHGTKYDNWCCKYGTHAPKAAGRCKQDGDA